MKIMSAVFFVLVLTISSLQGSFAANQDYDSFFNPNYSKYATILSSLIKKTEFLDLNEREKRNVLYLETFYLEILNEKSNEFNENELKIMEIVRKKGSNLKKARRLVRKNAELKLKLGYTFIESLEYIKTNLGISNYNKLMHSSEIDLFNIDEFESDKSVSNDNEIGVDLESTGIEEEAGSNQK